MKASVTGAPISTPIVSPTHQADQVLPISAGVIVPLTASAATERVELVRQAAGTMTSMKRARSTGSDSVSGCVIQRRIAQPPSAACSANSPDSTSPLEGSKIVWNHRV